MLKEIGTLLLFSGVMASVMGCRTTTPAGKSGMESVGRGNSGSGGLSASDLIGKKYCRPVVPEGRECLMFAENGRGSSTQSTFGASDQAREFTYEITVIVDVADGPFAPRVPSGERASGQIVRLWYSTGPAGTGVRDLKPSDDLKQLTSIDQPGNIFALEDSGHSANGAVASANSPTLRFRCARVNSENPGVEGSVFQQGNQIEFQYVNLPGRAPAGVTFPPPQLFSAKGTVVTDTPKKFNVALLMNGGENASLTILPSTGSGSLKVGQSSDKLTCKKGD